MNTADLAKKLKGGDSTALARAITLLESSRIEDWQSSKELLSQLGPAKLQTKRLGFSGPPGVGKSTFIEKMGLEIIRRGGRVAVLAIDPSSERTGGSILGDKTRMEELSRSDQAFVRPSPSRGHLGGVTSSLPGVILLCEAAGFDNILMESVGVGQSEIELSKMVDHFTLITQPGAGDELQGIKKGILEYVDLIAINKADRDGSLVNITRQQYLAALKIVRSNPVVVESCSALTGDGIKVICDHYEEFYKTFDVSRRGQFFTLWFDSLVLSEFKRRIKSNAGLSAELERLKKSIQSQKTSVTDAVDHFFTNLKF